MIIRVNFCEAMVGGWWEEGGMEKEELRAAPLNSSDQERCHDIAARSAVRRGTIGEELVQKKQVQNFAAR